MTTLITGANGFVGSAVTRQLLEQGHEVKALVRKNSNRQNLHNLRVSVVEGDLTDPPSLKQALAGCEFLFHVAADYRLWVPDPGRMYKTNVEGTEKLLRYAAGAGVNKIIYTSSVATLGINEDKTPADEDTPVTIEDVVGHYKRSKFLAEQAVWRLIENEKLPVTIVNPSAPVGPRDVKPTPTGRIIVDTLRKKVPAYVDTGLNIAHVDDVAKGHLLAFEKGRLGERYILGGENTSLKDLLDTICEIAGLSPPGIKLPRHVIYPAAWLAERMASISKKEPLITVDGVKMAKKFMYFSSDKAKRMLGYESRPARAAIEDAINWFRKNKL